MCIRDSLVRQGQAGRTVGIKVRLEDFSTHTRDRTLAHTTNDPALVGAVAADLLRRFDPTRPVRLLGVRVAGLGVEGPATAAAQEGFDQLELSF